MNTQAGPDLSAAGCEPHGCSHQENLKAISILSPLLWGLSRVKIHRTPIPQLPANSHGRAGLCESSPLHHCLACHLVGPYDLKPSQVAETATLQGKVSLLNPELLGSTGPEEPPVHSAASGLHDWRDTQAPDVSLELNTANCQTSLKTRGLGRLTSF